MIYIFNKSIIKISYSNYIGGAEEARTPDLFNAIEALSQLSYSPMEIQYTCLFLIATKKGQIRTLLIATIKPNININKNKILLNTNIKITGLSKNVIK